VITFHRPRSTKSGQTGVSAIEFAVMLPFLLVFLYGVLSYTVISLYQLSLNAMAAESARAAMVVYSSDPQGVNGREQRTGGRIDAIVDSSWIPQNIDGCAASGQRFGEEGGLLTVCLAVSLPIRPMQLGGFRLPDVGDALIAEASVSIHEN